MAMGSQSAPSSGSASPVSALTDGDRFELPTTTTSQLVLASSSPRRQSLLTEAGYRFACRPADIDESDYPPGTLPAEVARVLALRKAERIADLFPENTVLGADTVVAFGDQMLGKPTDAVDARDMLELLSGTTHVVITGVAVVRRADGHCATTRLMSAVRMRPLRPIEIDRYIATNEWMGKAGGYGIQDSDPFVTRVAGSHSNIVGLPMGVTRLLLAEAGIYPHRQHGSRA